MQIGEKIREARIAKGLSQAELGRLVGVQGPAIAKYENGRVINIKRQTLQKLALALGMQGDDLIIESDPKEKAGFHMQIMQDPELLELIRTYYSLSKEKQRTIRNLIETLAK